MSQTLELPDPLYAALHTAAEASGMTPTGWIAARLAERNAPAEHPDQPAPAERTPADLFAGRTGRIGSGGRECLSENGGTKFADYLEAKRQAGHL